MNNGEVTPTSQYVLSYNNNDFHSNNQDLVNSIFKNQPIQNVKLFCENKNSYSVYESNCNNTKKKTDTEKQQCAALDELCKNNEKYNKLKEIQTTHYASSGRYNDATQYHNTEMIKSVNLGIGIIGLSFIIYTLY
jgi:hypothetical protein